MSRPNSAFPNPEARALGLSLVIASTLASAQEPAGESDGLAELERITVFGEAIFRNRTNDTNPILSFGQEFFQRYEPESVGDMLKRVPGVAFSGDVGEFDAPQMRGLPAGYTQVLVNGKRVPGADSDRSVFVDRIPAELVERIEIVRSPSANYDAQGIGGTINIVLKNSASYQGLFASAGISYFQADSIAGLSSKTRGRGSLTWGASQGDLSWLLSASFTERYTPKTKETTVLEGDFNSTDLDEFVRETDVRDSDDSALNWDFDYRINDRGRLTFDGFFIQTDRTEREFVEAFEPDVDSLERFLDESINVRTEAFSALARETQLEDIDQTQWQVALGSQWMLSSHLDWTTGWSFARFDNDIETTETELDIEDDEFEEALEINDTRDEEWQFETDFDWDLRNDQALAFGAAWRVRERNESLREFEVGSDGSLDEETGDDAVFDIDEDVLSLYAAHTWRPSATVVLEHGLRFEYTDLAARNPAALVPESEQDYSHLLPSLNYRWDFTDFDRLHFSIARTVRRPNFNQLTPFVLDETPTDDEATQGNPDLEPETAWGLDLGYERQFAGRRGIAGINLFYRDIDDLIELTDTGTQFDDEFDLFRFENVGSGTLWGVELDFSAPLTVIGLENTSAFGNFVYLESEVNDPFTGVERDFNLLPEYIYNVGFNHAIRPLGLSFGASLQQRGKSRQFEADEIEILEYDGFLEAFIEKRFNDRWLLRLTGSNLLNQTKVERQTKFDSLSDFRAGAIEESELELEQTGPWFRLVLRGAF